MKAIKVGKHYECPECGYVLDIDKLDDETGIHFRLYCEHCNFNEDLDDED